MNSNTDSSVSTSVHVLVVEDDAAQCELIASILRSQHYTVSTAQSAEAAMVLLKQDGTIDVVLSDWKLGSLTGMDVLKFARKQNPLVGFAITTAYGTISHAVAAMEAGADDYLSKPFQRQTLLMCINKVQKAHAMRLQNNQLNAQLSEQGQLVDLVGNAPCMQRVYERIKRISTTNATVLITGESGTGKELAARALHELSLRNSAPFIAVNCGAIPEALAEAELFGAKKGAFTGAHQDKSGLLLSADTGTLFLDEIGELSLNSQTKLLRFLQEGTLTPVGAVDDVKVDVRVIAATHRDLQDMIARNEFREDLFYRLNVIPIEMPSLRERIEDIPTLVQFFTKKFSMQHGLAPFKLSKAALKAILSYKWPGNVRELSNRVERLVLLGDENALIDELQNSDAKRQDRFELASFKLPKNGINWDKFERQCLEQAMHMCQGNKTKAAALLGMSYKTFVYRLQKYTID
ncbi:sigma-54 dependent transcriptional regulator [Glaciecola sp. XM2]|nr:sigma-54 dependent transcriptional regulator [Glaciecola sp. XM2]